MKWDAKLESHCPDISFATYSSNSYPRFSIDLRCLVYSFIACDLSRSWQYTHSHSVSVSTVQSNFRQVAARCGFPYPPPWPVPSVEMERIKEITPGKDKLRSLLRLASKEFCFRLVNTNHPPLMKQHSKESRNKSLLSASKS